MLLLVFQSLFSAIDPVFLEILVLGEFSQFPSFTSVFFGLFAFSFFSSKLGNATVDMFLGVFEFRNFAKKADTYE